MVDQAEKEELDSLLQRGILTQEEYNTLLQNTHLENKRPSVIGVLFKVLLTTVLTILAIIAVLFGVCLALLSGWG